MTLAQYHTRWKADYNEIHSLSKPPAILPSNWHNIKQHKNLIMVEYILSPNHKHIYHMIGTISYNMKTWLYSYILTLKHQQIYQLIGRVSEKICIILCMLSLHIDNTKWVLLILVCHTPSIPSLFQRAQGLYSTAVVNTSILFHC